MQLIEAAKKLKEKNTQIKAVNDKIVVQNVEWDLDPSFIGEPMVPRVLKRLSLYVDQRLTDYSAIYGANPATNMPKAILDYGDEPTINLNNVQLGHNPDRVQSIGSEEPGIVLAPLDIVDGDELDEGDNPTGDTTWVSREERWYAPTPLLNDEKNVIMDDPHLFEAAEQVRQSESIRQQSAKVTRVLGSNNTTVEIFDDPRHISELRVHPGISTREELEARVRNDEGLIVDDPELFDPSENWLIRQHPRQRQDNHETRIRNRGQIIGEGFIPDGEGGENESVFIDDPARYDVSEKLHEIEDGYRGHEIIPEEVAIIEDEHVSAELEDRIMHRGTSVANCQVWHGEFKNSADAHISSEIKIPSESSLIRESRQENHCASFYVNTEGQVRDEITEKEAEPEADIHVLHSTDTPTEAEIQAGIVYTKQSFEPPSVASLLNQKELNHASSILLQAAAEEVASTSETPENLTMLLPGTTEGAVFSDSGEIVYPDHFTGPLITAPFPTGTSDEVEAHFANTGEVLFQPSPSPGVNLGLDIHDGVEIVPAEDQGIPHGADYHHEMEFNEVTQRGRAAGVQVDGINPANFRLEENFRNGAEGYDPTRVGVDNHVHANGALPGVRFRVRDSFIRNRHLTLKVPQYELMGPGSGGKDISYVTSYTIEHQTQKIKARIITAPPDLTLDDNLWFELCTNGTESDTLKDVVKNTVKANLCIYKPSRVAYYDQETNIRAEKIALETLRDMITEQEFRHYLRYGFLTVRGSSGRVYQIPRDGHHTKIWERGKLVEEVCVRIKDKQIPPTDNVIAFKVMVETNEEMFKALGNVYKNNLEAAA